MQLFHLLTNTIFFLLYNVYKIVQNVFIFFVKETLATEY